MKASVIRSALEGHGWIGLFIAIPLFIVFWAGSLTLFYPEIKAWSVLPHTDVATATPALPTSDIIAKQFEQYDINAEERIFIVLPTDVQPLYELYLPLNGESSPKGELTSIYVDPTNGETVASIDSFHLADFLYGLHIDLNLPFGDHIVGVITLFFMVVIFTGIVVQFKKLITHFFFYRGSQSTTRYQLTDMHNVVGVMSLPYTFMYALTGLMFNLGLISQVVTLLFVYNGDRTALLNDSGFPRITEIHAGVEREMPDLNAIITTFETEQNAKASSLRLTNYGDENALIRIIGQHNDHFAQRIDMTYRVKDKGFSKDINPEERNAFADGTRFLYALHFGHFAGVDVRIIFFILGLSVCGLIIIGNMLWLNKFHNNKNISNRLKRTMLALTLGGCAGIIPATAFAFLLERALSTTIESRALFVEASFFAVYGITLLAAFYTKAVLTMISRFSLISALVLTLLLTFEGIGFGKSVFNYLNNGYSSPFSLSFTLFCFTCLLFWLGANLSENAKTIQ